MKEIRQELILKMKELGAQGKGCADCKKANCCTFERNSMMITPLETIELYYYLKVENMWNKELIETLKQTITHYRLDKEIPSDGVRNFSRRSYTCPFLKLGPLACSIDPLYKPYGCLAFNATTIAAIDDEFCNSDQRLLEKLNNQYSDDLDTKNKIISKEIGVEEYKKSIPIALLELDKLNIDMEELKKYLTVNQLEADS